MFILDIQFGQPTEKVKNLQNVHLYICSYAVWAINRFITVKYTQVINICNHFDHQHSQKITWKFQEFDVVCCAHMSMCIYMYLIFYLKIIRQFAEFWVSNTFKVNKQFENNTSCKHYKAGLYGDNISSTQLCWYKREGLQVSFHELK